MGGDGPASLAAGLFGGWEQWQHLRILQPVPYPGWADGALPSASPELHAPTGLHFPICKMRGGLDPFKLQLYL